MNAINVEKLKIVFLPLWLPFVIAYCDENQTNLSSLGTIIFFFQSVSHLEKWREE
jgi:hypothetical protein